MPRVSLVHWRDGYRVNWLQRLCEVMVNPESDFSQVTQQGSVPKVSATVGSFILSVSNQVLQCPKLLRYSRERFTFGPNVCVAYQGSDACCCSTIAATVLCSFDMP